MLFPFCPPTWLQLTQESVLSHCSVHARAPSHRLPKEWQLSQNILTGLNPAWPQQRGNSEPSCRRRKRTGLHADGATHKNQTSEGPAEKDQTAAEPTTASNKNTALVGFPFMPSVCVFENAACLPLWFVCAFVKDIIKPNAPQTTITRCKTQVVTWETVCRYENLSYMSFCQGNVLVCQLELR